MKRQDASTGQIVEDNVAAKDNGKTMHVKVYSPFKTYFDEDAESISGINGTGPFDILPRHHNFLTLLSPCDLVVRIGGRERRVRIARGIMHVKGNEVVVFLDV
jgi:F0F1-type ATP synthase epsilon subunit